MADHEITSPRVARLTWITIVVNLAVIVWGAFVRASHSGAGCGNHWPLCNGEVVPTSPTIETVIELTHRVTSGMALLLVLALLVLVYRDFPRRHRVRVAAWVALLVIIAEALIGAGLVRFELVGDNASLERAVTLGAHLLNTLILLAALTGLALWSAGLPRLRLGAIGLRGWWFALGTLGLVAVGTTGAIASLGDTLFPARTLREGFAQDLDPTSHLLLRLRVLHPTIAVAVGVLAVWVATTATRWVAGVESAGRRVVALVLVQWTVGVVSLMLLVPIPMQLVHLLLADLLWISWMMLAARVLASQDPVAGLSSDTTARAASASNTVPADFSR